MRTIQSIGYWRVGLVFLIYGILFLGAKGIIDYRMSILLIPTYVFFRPRDIQVMEKWERVKTQGVLFYVLKWTAVILGLFFASLALFAYYTGKSPVAIVVSVAQEPLYIAGGFLTAYVSWFNHNKQFPKYQKYLQDMQRQLKKRSKKRKA